MKDKIRLAVLNGEADKIKELLLNETQVSQLLEIYDSGLFSAERLAKAFDVSIQNASAKLRRFYTGGYLDRAERTAPSGGIEYYYTVPKWKTDKDFFQCRKCGSTWSRQAFDAPVKCMKCGAEEK